MSFKSLWNESEPEKEEKERRRRKGGKEEGRKGRRDLPLSSLQAQKREEKREEKGEGDDNISTAEREEGVLEQCNRKREELQYWHVSQSFKTLSED